VAAQKDWEPRCGEHIWVKRQAPASLVSDILATKPVAQDIQASLKHVIPE
jgi:hypothetical protein